MSDALVRHLRLHGRAQPKGNDCPRKWSCCSEADKGGCDSLICHIDLECFWRGVRLPSRKETDYIIGVPRDRDVECDHVILVIKIQHHSCRYDWLNQ